MRRFPGPTSPTSPVNPVRLVTSRDQTVTGESYLVEREPVSLGWVGRAIMASPGKRQRYESSEAKNIRLRRTLMACFRKDQKYRDLIQGSLATSRRHDSPQTYSTAVRNRVSDTLHLNASDGSGPPTWAIRAVYRDVEMYLDKVEIEQRGSIIEV
jgi:hypothetical protein